MAQKQKHIGFIAYAAKLMIKQVQGLKMKEKNEKKKKKICT